MTRWDYLTLLIGLSKKQRDYVLERAGSPPLIGLPAILAQYGADGWELVSLDPDQLKAYPGFGTWTIEPEQYRATFKRPSTH